MSRYFALPVLAVVLSLVGLRRLALPEPGTGEPLEIVVSLPAQEPDATPQEPKPIVTRADLWEAPAPVVTAAPKPEAAAPIAIEASAPVVRTEVIERTVVVTQQTVVYAPTTIYAPAAAPESEPRRETAESPVIVILAPSQGRLPHPPRRPEAQQDPFFKTIPFLPPTPRSPRWNP